MMDAELPTDWEELIRTLGDRIEEIERTLLDDEDFCNKDLDATYQAGVKYLKFLQAKFGEKLNELKTKLDRLREENGNISKQNRKQFDDEIEEINQLFFSGKRQEALDKFHDYEKCFEQRTTITRKIPKLYMNDMDINQYFSIGKPIITPQIPLQINKENPLNTPKPSPTNLPINGHNQRDEQQQSPKPCYDVRFKRSVSQQVVQPNHLTNKDRQISLPTASPRAVPFSTRLPPSPSTRSPTPVENAASTTTVLSKQNSNRNLHENNNNHQQVRSTPSSPNIVSPLRPSQISILKTSKGEGLSPTQVAPYQYQQNTLLTMTSNQNYLILFRNQPDRYNRWYSTIFKRSNLTEPISQWHNHFIKSIGFIDATSIYIFTEREFLIYSIDLISKLYSCILLTDQNYTSDYNNVHLGFGGTVYGQHIYHIYLNTKYHWILSVLTLEKINHLSDHDLSDILPDLKTIIQICINDRTINFLVEMHSSQYAVMICSNNFPLKIELKRLIPLSYAGKPLSICSVYIPYIQKDIYFINDPSMKIIHLLTNEKYLQSYSIIAHTLCYIEENHELILTSNDGIYSININEHQQFFSKFH